MIYAVPHDEKNNNARLFDDMYRERHRLYVEGRGWKELGRVDGREIDEFDTSATIYLMAVCDRTGKLLGSIRLNPTTSPHLLDTVFPELCSVQEIPKGISTWEMSRLFVCHHDEIDENGISIKGSLFCAMYEFCLIHNIEHVSAVCDSYFLPRVLKAGVTAKPLGLPKPYESGEMMGVQIDISAEDLVKIKAAYQVPDNTLTADLSLSDSSISIRDIKDPVKGDETTLIANISDELELLSLMGARKKRDEFIMRFSEILPKLCSSNKSVVRKAEKELDELTDRVRSELYSTSGYSKISSSRLQ